MSFERWADLAQNLISSSTPGGMDCTNAFDKFHQVILDYPVNEKIRTEGRTDGRTTRKHNASGRKTEKENNKREKISSVKQICSHGYKCSRNAPPPPHPHANKALQQLHNWVGGREGGRKEGRGKKMDKIVTNAKIPFSGLVTML